MMKRKFLQLAVLCAVVLLPLSDAYSQKKCKYNFDKVDPMSNERVRRNRITGTTHLLFAFYRKGNDFRFETQVKIAGNRDFSVPKGQVMNIKLGNGEIIEAPNSDKSTPNSFIYNNNVATSYSMSYKLTREQVEKIANHGFTVVSTKLGNETITFEFKEKRVYKNKEKVACMLVD